MLDELDQELLREIARNPGASVIEVVRPFLGRKSLRALRDRIRSFEHYGLIRTKKERDRVRVFPRDLGGALASEDEEGRI
jgi:predicted transcriptional regulator